MINLDQIKSYNDKGYLVVENAIPQDKLKELQRVTDEYVINSKDVVSNDDFTTEFYIENLTDERAEISRNFVFDKEYATYMRPMTIGIRYKRNF